MVVTKSPLAKKPVRGTSQITRCILKTLTTGGSGRFEKMLDFPLPRQPFALRQWIVEPLPPIRPTSKIFRLVEKKRKKKKRTRGRREKKRRREGGKGGRGERERGEGRKSRVLKEFRYYLNAHFLPMRPPPPLPVFKVDVELLGKLKGATLFIHASF